MGPSWKSIPPVLGLTSEQAQPPEEEEEPVLAFATEAPSRARERTHRAASITWRDLEGESMASVFFLFILRRKKVERGERNRCFVDFFNSKEISPTVVYFSFSALLLLLLLLPLLLLLLFIMIELQGFTIKYEGEKMLEKDAKLVLFVLEVNELCLFLWFFLFLRLLQLRNALSPRLAVEPCCLSF